MIEALKDEGDSTFILGFLRSIYDNLKKHFEKGGIIISDDIDYRLKMFFIHTAPILSYIIIGDKWADFHNVPREDADRKIIEILKELHGTFILTDGKLY